MRWLPVGASIAAGVLNVAATLLGRGSFGHTIVVLIAAVYVGLPLAAIGVVLWSLRRRFPRLRAAAIVSWTIAAVALSLVLSMWLGGRLAADDVADAQAYCEQLAAQLDRHKQAFGTYPRELSGVRADGVRPRLLRESLSYWSDGGRFEFSFVDPVGVLGSWSYGSVDRRWVYSD